MNRDFWEENNFLLIEVFSKLFNAQNYGHQGSILGGIFYFHLPVDIPDKNSKILTTEQQFFIFTS